MAAHDTAFKPELEFFVPFELSMVPPAAGAIDGRAMPLDRCHAYEHCTDYAAGDRMHRSTLRGRQVYCDHCIRKCCLARGVSMMGGDAFLCNSASKSWGRAGPSPDGRCHAHSLWSARPCGAVVLKARQCECRICADWRARSDAQEASDDALLAAREWAGVGRHIAEYLVIDDVRTLFES
jgi:hypothetical protein